MASLQQTYYDILAARVRADQYPSHQLLDRLEASLFTSEQLTDYISLLLEKLNETRYPSHQILDRTERMLVLAAGVA